MSFMLRGRKFKVEENDLLIWQMTTDFGGIVCSDDFNADLLLISNSFLGRYNPEQVWATRGYMFIKANPVFHLEGEEIDIIGSDFRQFRLRIGSSRPLFHDEKVGELLRLLLYDMWDIYSRKMTEGPDTQDLTSGRFLQFLLLVQQDCKRAREVAYYADKLNITPKYLSEISRNISGQPAMRWIEYYAAHELLKRLSDPSLTLADIADEMEFSSQAALTRYLKRVTGKTPSEYRKPL